MELLLDKRVKLFNGAEVSWDEFSRWSAHRQMMNLTPVSENITYGVDHCHKMREIVKQSYEDGNRKTNWNYGAKNGQSKSVRTPAGEFPCIKAACLYYKISATKLKVWIKDRPEEFYFTNIGLTSSDGNCRTKGRKVSTPEGVFPSIKAAARHFKVGERTIKTWIRKMRSNEFKFI
ncbi:hypothetical protein G6652_03125 [Polynucleobacter paneuropaeus]|jgi:hypothetical protein|nr:hypothetical protein [Polynucleobacter paneuropaeus]MBT8576312.1 hypothetical protein [Polynucleobacter paneuropaeus]MBT8614740.1 hypothetical protein [Polynucleobacter paneuropaeus]MBT8616222.1 hypothetical protein [Polynucleobacter paneuropaeus]MBT8618103.1 hypothetical protein [Polynucleobacter paneuropaeus]